MSIILSFFVPGTPVPKGRPRVTRSGHAYTPARTVAWEQTVAAYGLAARNKAKLFQPLSGELRVELAFAGLRANADIDNGAKAVLDGLNRVLYHDDSQVVELHAVRIQGAPGVLVEVS